MIMTGKYAFRLLGFALTVCLLFSAVSADAGQSGEEPRKLDKVVLQLKWKHLFQFAGYYAAHEKGFYREAGLEVVLKEKRNKTDSVVDAVLRGDAHYGIDSSNVIVKKLSGQTPVILASVFQHSPVVLVSLSDTGIRTPRDLRGKRIMINPANEAELKAMLLYEGIDASTIDWRSQAFDLQAMLNHEADAFNIYLTNQQHQLEEQNIAYNILNPIEYGVDFYSDFLFTSQEELMHHPQRVKAFRAASLKGWDYALRHPEEIIALILSDYSQSKSREALRYEAQEIAKLVSIDQVPLGHINPGRIQRMAKALVDLGTAPPPADITGLVYSDAPLYTDLTEAEQLWLNQKHKVRVRITNVPPLYFVRDGLPQGVAVDYLKKITEAYGIEFELLDRKVGFSEDLQNLSNRTQIDLLLSARATPQRRQKILFTDSYITLNEVIFSRDDVSFIGGISDLNGKKIAVPKGFSLRTKITAAYPEIDIVVAASMPECVDLLSSGQVDAFIGNLMTASYYIQGAGISNIKVVAPVNLQNPDHHMAVRNDWPELASLINRVFGALSEQENQDIRNKWLSVRYEYGISSSDVWRWALYGLALVLSVLAIFTLWNRRLAQEISQRKDTENELLGAITKYKQLVQTIPHGIVELNTEGEIVYANEPLCHMLGIEQHQFSGRSFFACFENAEPWDLNVTMLQSLVESPRTVRSFMAEVVHPARETTNVRIDLMLNRHEQKVVSYIAVITDTGVEKALEESQEIYRITYDAAQVGIAHLDREGRFIKSNKCFCSMLGYSKEELLNLPIDKLVHPEDREEAPEKLRNLLSSGETTYSVERRYLKKGGQSLWIFATVTMLPKAEHNAARYVAVIQDVNDLKLSQLATQQLSISLEQQIAERTCELTQRVAEVEQLNRSMTNLAENLKVSNKELESFAYSVSHDLRAPLRHISGFISIMQEKYESLDAASRRVYLVKIGNAAVRMGDLIDDLIGFTQTGRVPLHLMRVDTLTLVEDIKDGVMQRAQGRNIEWQLGSLPLAYADRATLRHVFTHLIENAVKYTEGRNPAKIGVESFSENQEQVFKVTDNGVGFNPEHSDKLFAVFQRLHQHDEFEGTGIGLASVKRIVNRYGGRTWAEGRPGLGATFYFSLPLVMEENSDE